MKYATGAALIMVAGLLWSAQGLLIRNIHDSGPWSVLFWRSVGMLPVLLIWLSKGSASGLVSAMALAGMAGPVGGLGLVLAFSGAIFSMQSTTIANAVLLFSVSPFFAAILGVVLLREKVSVLTWFSMALAVAGVMVMVGGAVGGGGMTGNVAALISAFGFGAFTVALRWGKLANMLPAVVYGGIFSMITGAVVALQLGQPLSPSLHDAAVADIMGTVTLSGGMFLYTHGSKVVPAAQATLFSLVEVLLAPVWVWLVLGETFSVGTALGGAVLLAAVLINAFGGRAALQPATA